MRIIALLLPIAACLVQAFASETATNGVIDRSETGPIVYKDDGEQEAEPSSAAAAPADKAANGHDRPAAHNDANNVENGVAPTCRDPTEPGDCNKQEPQRTSNKVVVIGCGPGGMFFLHALAMKRKKLQDAGDMEGLARMPDVTVYEKASEPGGVWKPYGKPTSKGSVDMAVGTWVNGNVHEIELFDYTFEDHFGGSIPVYIPRSKLLDYMKARVTRVEDVFQYVKFNTEVTSVVYDKGFEKFVVTTKDEVGREDIEVYDKCIWAGGMHGKAKYPTRIVAMLKSGGYVGRTMHATELAGLSVANKRILIIGDNYSGEDIALQALKMGAEHVYITTLQRSGVASWVSTWPGNRVDILAGLPTAVIHNGTGLLVAQMDKTDTNTPLEGGDSMELENVAAVIYCTGYSRDDYYMSKELRLTEYAKAWKGPQNWTAPPNMLTNDVGEVPLSDYLTFSNYVTDGVYRNVLMSNPNMMYLVAVTASLISETDAIAWRLASYVSGELALPPVSEMERRNYQDRVDELSVPYLREAIDDNYKNALEKLISDQPSHWMNTYSREHGYGEFFADGTRHAIKLIARHQHESGHGGGWGTYDKLSPRGESLVTQHVQEEWARPFRKVPEESQWKTFRDCDPASYHSIYTGATAVPLAAHWMDLDDDGNVLTPPDRHAIDVGVSH